MIALLLLVIFAPLIVATSVFVVETGLGAFPPRAGQKPLLAFDPTTVVVLVPAHDEAAGIAANVVRQRAGMVPGMRLVVVADNCSDGTAALARGAGAEVVERHDVARRGKGFALDFGRAGLAVDPPACVIVVDADTVLAEGALARLAARSLAEGRPIQGAYSMTVGDAEGSVARFSAAAFFIKNVVRELGGARIGAPAILTGSGMAFPWAIFAQLPLATGHVAEDLMLGVQCSKAGNPPRFDPHAIVIGVSSSDKGTAVQRRRWESGFVQVARDDAMPLIAQALREGRPALAWLGLHLLTPPLVLLLAADIVASVAAGMLALLGVASYPVWIIVILTASAVLCVIAGLAGHRRLHLLRDWASMPRYVLWKLGLSLLVLIRRERRWIRTDRD